jgi:sporulation protein YlmC with PRC-barrel domain
MTTTLTEYPRVLSASTLKNESVRNPAGEEIGKIEEYMIKLPTGRITYCVLSFGGLLGMGEKFFAVPFNAMTVDTESRCFVLNVDPERLKQAPGFDKERWPDFADHAWGTKIYTFYRTRPYWEEVSS